MYHPHEKYGKNMVEMLQSFNSAVQQAGGTILSADALRRMTAEDLFLLLASNGVRFCYQKKQEDERCTPDVDTTANSLSSSDDLRTAEINERIAYLQAEKVRLADKRRISEGE